MSHKTSSDDKVAAACGRAVEGIIAGLVGGKVIEITHGEPDMRQWGFPDLPSMRMTLEELQKALPDPLDKLLIVRGMP